MASPDHHQDPCKPGVEQRESVEISVHHHSEDEFKWNIDIITNLISLYLTYFATVWSLGAPAGSIIYIMVEYPGTDPALAAWIAAAPAVVLCAVQLFMGELSDIFGRRGFLLVAAGFGITGTLVGGLATSVNMVIGGQVLNGASVALGYLALPLLAEMVPKRHRPTILGTATFLVGLVATFISTIQGVFMKYEIGGKHKGWRIGFYLNTGLWILTAVSLFFFYRPGRRPNPEGLSTAAQLRRLDWTGMFMGVAGLVFFLLGLNYGGNPYPWNSARVVCFLVLGAILLVSFAVWEWKGTKQGLLPHSLFVYRNFPVTLILSFTEGMIVYGAQTFFPQMTMQLITQDFIMVTIWNVPTGIAGIAGAILFSLIFAKTREAKWVTVAGIGLFTLGIGLLPIMKANINMAAWVIPIIIIGSGSGALGVVIPVISSVCTPNRWVATSIALGISARGLGGSVGTVIFSSIYSGKLRTALPARIAKAVVDAGLPSPSVPQLLEAYGSADPALLAEVPGFDSEVAAALKAGAESAYAYGFQFIWFSMLPFAVLTFGITFLLQSTKAQLSNEVASAVEARHDHGRPSEKDAEVAPTV